MATINVVTNIATDTNTYITGTEVFDQNSNLTIGSTGSSLNSDGMVFTAPVTGKYQFNAWVEFENAPSNASYLTTAFITTARNFYTKQGAHDITGGNHNIACSVLTDMDVGDQATLMVYQPSGTASTDILGGQSAFSGFLIG